MNYKAMVEQLFVVPAATMNSSASTSTSTSSSSDERYAQWIRQYVRHNCTNMDELVRFLQNLSTKNATVVGRDVLDIDFPFDIERSTRHAVQLYLEVDSVVVFDREDRSSRYELEIVEDGAAGGSLRGAGGERQDGE